MKRIWTVLICVLVVLAMAGCGIIDNSVSIKTIEQDLGMDLGELSEKKVQAVYKDLKGETVIVRIQLLGWQERLDAQLADSDKWHPMPMDNDTMPFLQQIPNLNLDLDSIRTGYWTLGTEENADGNPVYKVGFWDSEAEYLYYFRVTIVKPQMPSSTAPSTTPVETTNP